MRTLVSLSPCVVLLLLGCVDLPDGWDGATQIVDLTQSECTEGSPYDEHDERIEVVPGAGSVGVSYLEAHFRCEQDVEAFFLRGESGPEILVQPEDMDPSSVAACDCLYDIDLTIRGLDQGETTVKLFRRWDTINEPNDPILVGEETVVVD